MGAVGSGTRYLWRSPLQFLFHRWIRRWCHLEGLVSCSINRKVSVADLLHLMEYCIHASRLIGILIISDAYSAQILGVSPVLVPEKIHMPMLCPEYQFRPHNPSKWKTAVEHQNCWQKNTKSAVRRGKPTCWTNWIWSPNILSLRVASSSQVSSQFNATSPPSKSKSHFSPHSF